MSSWRKLSPPLAKVCTAMSEGPKATAEGAVAWRSGKAMMSIAGPAATRAHGLGGGGGASGPASLPVVVVVVVAPPLPKIAGLPPAPPMLAAEAPGPERSLREHPESAKESARTPANQARC